MRKKPSENKPDGLLIFTGINKEDLINTMIGKLCFMFMAAGFVVFLSGCGDVSDDDYGEHVVSRYNYVLSIDVPETQSNADPIYKTGSIAKDIGSGNSVAEERD